MVQKRVVLLFIAAHKNYGACLPDFRAFPALKVELLHAASRRKMEPGHCRSCLSYLSLQQNSIKREITATVTTLLEIP
jgi:hypothetical protein